MQHLSLQTMLHQLEKQESQKRIHGQNDHLDWCAPSRALEVCKTYYKGIQDKFSFGVWRLRQGSGSLSWGALQQGTARAESSSAALLRRNVLHTSSGNAPSNICSLHFSFSFLSFFKIHSWSISDLLSCTKTGFVTIFTLLFSNNPCHLSAQVSGV